MDQTQDFFHKKVKKSVALLQENISGLRQTVLQTKRFPEEVWQAMAQVGLMGCLIPKEYGGNHLGLLELAWGMENFSTCAYASPLPMLTNMAIICLVRHGSDELKKKFLPKLASGGIKSCVAATEEVSGTNMFRIETRADKKEGRYILNGSKIYISGADIADKMLVLVRTKTAAECQKEGLPKTFGLSVFFIDVRSSGVTLEKMPTRGEVSLQQNIIRFKDVKISEEDLIGPQDMGAMVMFDAINVERVLGTALVLGVSQHCLDVATDYAKKRNVFGEKTIASYQAIQHPLAETKIRQEACRLMMEKAACFFDEAADPSQVGFYANMAKYLGAELGLKAVDAAIETLGGKGFHENHDLIHLWEQARLFKTAPVSNNMILNFIAEHTLGLPRSY